MLGIFALMIGPLILVLTPVWLLGVWVHHFNSRHSISGRVGWSLFLGSVVTYLSYRYFYAGTQLTAMSDSWINPIMDPIHLHKARFFLHDYVVGVLVALHLIGANALARTGRLPLHVVEQPIRFAASFTFSLYLLHYPLLNCLAALAPWPPGDIRRTVMVIAGSFVVILLIGSVTEKKKHLWKGWFTLLWESTSRRVFAHL